MGCLCLRKYEDYLLTMHDYAGMRTQKGSVRYFWQGDQLLAENNPNYNAFTYFYYDETGISGMKVNENNGLNYYFRKNIFGDVTDIYHSSGNWVGGYTYDAWGKTTIKPNSGWEAVVNPFRYRGYYQDEETGFYYLNSRYYDPEVGRFISPDDPRMLFETAGVAGGANLYAYCLNNPVSYTDSTGMSIWSDIGNWFKGTASRVVLTVASAGMVIAGTAVIVLSGGAALNLGTALIGAGIGSAIGTWTADNALAGFTIGAAAGGLVGFTLGAGASMLAAGGTKAFAAASATFIKSSLVTFVGAPLVATAAVGFYNVALKGMMDQWESLSLLERTAVMQTTGIRSPLSLIASGVLSTLVAIRLLYS